MASGERENEEEEDGDGTDWVKIIVPGNIQYMNYVMLKPT